jgi:hypothetical protein
MRVYSIVSAAILAACCAVGPGAAWAGLVFGPAARTQFEGYRDNPAILDTFIDFNSLAAGTKLATQFSAQGVTFSSNINTDGTPFGPVHVEVSSAVGGITIVGSPCDPFCGDDGRVGYQIVFAAPQRRAGLLRIWNADTRTRFYSQSGLLAEHPGTGFVGYIADGTDPATQWVARIQIDGVVNSGSRQVGYSDDLFFGSAGLNITVPLVSGFNLTGNGFTAALNVLTMFGNSDAPVAGVSDTVEAVWAWNPATPPGKWQFHTPQFTVANSAAYALANGYEVLTSVPAGAGYWISAVAPFSLSAPAGTAFNYSSGAFALLPPSFNLLSIGSTLTVQQFNVSVGAAQSNFNALWAWDASRTKWYFYSPTLEPTAIPAPSFTNAEYCAANGYQDFAGGTPVGVPALNLQPGVGFWVEKN